MNALMVEPVVMFSALRYLFGGFRTPLPPGFSYVRTWASLPLLIALPLLTIPEMLVLDLLLWHAPAWRAASDILHVYVILWCVGIVATARARPHLCDGDRVQLRFGCLRQLELDRTNIAGAAVRRAVRGKEPGTLVMTLDGVPTVELTLQEPVVYRSLLGGERLIRRVLVAVDEPAAFAKAVAA